MIKILSVVVLFSLNAYAQNFDEFLNNALKNSPYLKSMDLTIKQTALEGKTLTRYENPSVDLEYSQFKPDTGNDENGYRLGVSQPMRLWGVSQDKQGFSDASSQRMKSNFILSNAMLSKNISLIFVEYAKTKELYTLAKEELKIAQRIYEISQARFDVGTISKGEMLQAKVDFEMVDIHLGSLKLDYKEEYFKLLEIAGLSQEIELNHKYEFKIKNQNGSFVNPDLEYLNKTKQEAIALQSVNSHKIEYIDFAAEYEAEPDQDIFRVGVSIPLAIFNTKKEELQIAKLEVNKVKLLSKMQSNKISLKMIKLKQQREQLKKLKVKNKTILKTQEKLLLMFEDGYKIANTNLLELQNVKNRVINTKEALIQIKFALDTNAINTNYVTGAYNE